jgi:2'-5' RNA ligase
MKRNELALIVMVFYVCVANGESGVVSGFLGFAASFAPEQIADVQKKLTESGIFEAQSVANLHLTVKYLGKHDRSELVSALASFQSPSLEPSRAIMGQIKLFPEAPDVPHVVVLEVAHPQLQTWRKELNQHLERLGFSKDSFPDYKPHITLGFIRDANPSKMTELERQIKVIERTFLGQNIALSGLSAYETQKTEAEKRFVPYALYDVKTGSVNCQDGLASVGH